MHELPPEPEPCPDCGYPIDACECPDLFGTDGVARYTTTCEDCGATIETLTATCPECGFDRRTFDREDSDE